MTSHRMPLCGVRVMLVWCACVVVLHRLTWRKYDQNRTRRGKEYTDRADDMCTGVDAGIGEEERQREDDHRDEEEEVAGDQELLSQGEHR